MRLRRALEEFVVDGIDTTIPLHQRLIAENDFINGDYDIHWLERFVDRPEDAEGDPRRRSVNRIRGRKFFLDFTGLQTSAALMLKEQGCEQSARRTFGMEH